jgi:hypothetical protein
MSEFEFEPVPGLPAELPPGEQLLWQGSPAWSSVAAHVLHLRMVSYYFGAVILLRLAAGLYLGQTLPSIAVSMSWLTLLGVGTVGFLAWVARLIAAGTIYSVTSRRIVMRFGMVVPISINIPFKVVRSAALRSYDDGTGDIPLQLSGNGRIAYPHLWPHAMPWAMRNPQPMLRGVPDARSAASVLARALERAAA